MPAVRTTVVAHRTGQPVLGHDLQDLLLHLACDLAHLLEQLVPGAPEGLNKRFFCRSASVLI